MTLSERIECALAEFRLLHADWRASVDAMTVAPATGACGAGGIALFVVTHDGTGFEFPLSTDDHVADVLGVQVH